jgi:MFS family permease
MTSSKRIAGHLFSALCLLGFFAILSSTMSKSPVLNPFARALGTPDSLMGFIAAASTIPGILVSLPAGSLSDRFGRRKVLLASCIIFASAPFLYLPVNSWWQLALVRFYHGFATAMFVPVGNAFVAELFPDKRAERISLFSSATIVGRSIAPFLGGYILFVTNYGFHELYLAVGVAGVAAFVTALLLMREKTETVGKSAATPRMAASRFVAGWAALARNQSALIVSLVEASQYYAYGATEFFLVGYLNEIAGFNSLSQGIILGSQLAVIPIVKPLMGRLSDRTGRTIPIVTGSLISALALGAIPFTTEFSLLLSISILYGIGFSTVTSSTPALISELVDKALVGTGMGFLATIMDIGQTLGPIMTGLILATTLKYTGSFMSLAVILLGACGVFAASRISRMAIKRR